MSVTKSPADRKVILTGDRPTGPLHLGHYVGSLKNRVAYQHEYKQFVLVADAQALTDNTDDRGKVHRNVSEVALDYLAVGIDPDVTTICVQTWPPELTAVSYTHLTLPTNSLVHLSTVSASIQKHTVSIYVHSVLNIIQHSLYVLLSYMYY